MFVFKGLGRPVHSSCEHFLRLNKAVHLLADYTFFRHLLFYLCPEILVPTLLRSIPTRDAGAWGQRGQGPPAFEEQGQGGKSDLLVLSITNTILISYTVLWGISLSQICGVTFPLDRPYPLFLKMKHLSHT